MFSAKKGNSEKSCYVYCRLSIRFLGVPLFGAKTGRYTPFWRSLNKITHRARTTKILKKNMTRLTSRNASSCLGGTQVLVLLAPAREGSFGS